MLSQSRTTVSGKCLARSVAIGVATTAAFGCAEVPTSARLSPHSLPALTDAGGGSSLFSNAVKYRDAGAKPATGRSGSASIESRALLGKDGVTLVELTTGILDDPGTPPGQIVKVQTKLFSPDNGKTVTTNDKVVDGKGYWSESYAGLLRNGTVQTQANVRGIDPERTDVVTTTNLVKLRPDVAALQVSGPARAYTGTLVEFVALIAEHNRDVGARAACVLFVDDAEVARGSGIWVDAGSSVSCAFRTTFATTGTKTVRVDVSGVTPGDWDPANNSASTTIEVVDPSVPLSYSAAAYHYKYSYSYQYSWAYTGGDFGNSTEVGKRDESGAYVSAWTPSALQLPLASASFSMSRDGSPFRSIIASDIYYFDDGYGGTCFSTGTNGISIYGCAYSWGQANIVGHVYGGHVAYFVKGFDNRNGSWSYNYEYIDGEGPFDIGKTVALDLRVADATGTTYTATPEILIQPEPISLDYEQSSCYEDFFYRFKSCTDFSRKGTQWYGSAFKE